jgi:hypothetical protein
MHRVLLVALVALAALAGTALAHDDAPSGVDGRQWANIKKRNKRVVNFDKFYPPGYSPPSAKLTVPRYVPLV